MPATISPSP
jgi:hypothetical protein